MEAYWVSKIHPEKYPDRYITDLWLKLLAKNFGIHIHINELSGKQFGQFKSLRQKLGDHTQYVVEWMLTTKHWNYFTGKVQMMKKVLPPPPFPGIGFLVKHREKALRLMRFELLCSTVPAEMDFVQKVENKFYKRNYSASGRD